MQDRTASRLIEQNPWWRDRRAIGDDMHLRALERSPFVWHPAALDEIDLDRPTVYTLRGPRQVGKTTLLKTLVRRRLDQGFPAERVLYFSLDLERDPREIVELVTVAKSISSGPGPWCVLLDEISSVPRWQQAVKHLRDVTASVRDCFVLTGSSGADIRAGAERLPGRRGPGRGLDKLMLPMSFREWYELTASESLPEPLTLRQLAEGRGLGAWLGRAAALDRALGRYLATGGLPAAVRDGIGTRALTAETLDTLWAVMAGTVDRAGRDRASAARILDRVVRSLGSPISWNSVAQDAGLGSTHTAQGYATFLAESYVLLLLHAIEIGRGPALRKQKKIYFVDPAFAHLPASLDPASPSPVHAALVENAVAIELYRTYEREPVESLALPQRVFHWRSTSGREVDFVVRDGPRHVPIEVKYQGRISGKDKEAIVRSFGSGLILSRQSFDVSGPVPAVPAAVFLAAHRPPG